MIYVKKINISEWAIKMSEWAIEMSEWASGFIF